jgi:hypothetical protein
MGAILSRHDAECAGTRAEITLSVKRRAEAVLAEIDPLTNTIEDVLAKVTVAIRESGGVLVPEWVGFSAMTKFADTSGRKATVRFERLRAYPIYVGVGTSWNILWLVTTKAGKGPTRVDEMAAIWDELSFVMPIAELTGMAVGAAERLRAKTMAATKPNG